MGILNVTSDSFSDGGRYLQPDQALFRARAMVAEGAAIIDIGGESTRPGATPVGVQEELDRVMPLIEALHAEFPLPLSLDTHKPTVMAAAIAAGIGIINDIRALQTAEALEIVATSRVVVCLMHMQGEPGTMQVAPFYDDVVTQVKDFLTARIAACRQAGIANERILVDPGFGFGKTVKHNILLLQNLDKFKALAGPVLVGLSRKAMIGKLLNATPEERLAGSLALAVMAVQKGANIIRAHDVKSTVDVITITQAVLDEKDDD